MKELDLHGVRHADVERLVEDFVVVHEPPFRIITGNSAPMKKLVKSVLDRYGLDSFHESDWNLGALIITEIDME